MVTAQTDDFCVSTLHHRRRRRHKDDNLFPQSQNQQKLGTKREFIQSFSL